MTRINCVPPETLTDKHLLAEYKEITRPFNKVIDRINKHGVDNALTGCDISPHYILNRGHETFFFDKLAWLWARRRSVFGECIKRGFSVDHEKYHDIQRDFFKVLKPTPYWNDWQPTPEDMYLNMARLVIRSTVVPAHDEVINWTSAK